MADNGVIVLDETDDNEKKKVIVLDESGEETELSPEELEERERAERLAKLKKGRKFRTDKWALAMKALIICGLAGIMLSMLLQSGVGIAVSLALIFVCEILNYVFK